LWLVMRPRSAFTVPPRDRPEIFYLVVYGSYFTPDLRMNAFFFATARTHAARVLDARSLTSPSQPTVPTLLKLLRTYEIRTQLLLRPPAECHHDFADLEIGVLILKYLDFGVWYFTITWASGGPQEMSTGCATGRVGGRRRGRPR
jgi:hypothetical protein